MALLTRMAGAGHGPSGAWDALAPEWDRLALERPSPFVTHEWLTCWYGAFGRGRRCVVTLRAPGGALRAGALLTRTPLRGLSAPFNDHSGDWDAVADSDAARAELWRRVAGLDAPVVTLGPLLAERAAPARAALEAAGRRVHEAPADSSPYLRLPASFDELMAGASRNLRSQVGRRRRALERQGRLVFRTTTTGGPQLERDLGDLLRVEASGWKRRNGTAIVSDPSTTRLYCDFARAAAGRGWLRLHLLELDGEVIAGDLGCALGGSAFLVKTGFDERFERLSPGLVLRAEALRASIEEDLRAYDFLGGPDHYKLRWTDELRPRVVLRGFSRVRGAGAEVYRRALRPALARARHRREGKR